MGRGGQVRAGLWVRNGRQLERYFMVYQNYVCMAEKGLLPDLALLQMWFASSASEPDKYDRFPFVSPCIISVFGSSRSRSPGVSWRKTPAGNRGTICRGCVTFACVHTRVRPCVRARDCSRVDETLLLLVAIHVNLLPLKLLRLHVEIHVSLLPHRGGRRTLKQPGLSLVLV
jgi:hypothetical protein